MVDARPRPRARGFTVLETVVGLAVVTIVMTAALDGGRLPAIAATRSLDRLQATRAASTALERLDRSTLVAGEQPFDPRMPGASGRLFLRAISPILFEASATVGLPDGTAITTTTRLVREGGR